MLVGLVLYYIALVTVEQNLVEMSAVIDKYASDGLSLEL